MGPEAIIGLVTALGTLLGLIIKARTNRKANRDALGKVESTELRDSMDAVDRMHPDTPKD